MKKQKLNAVCRKLEKGNGTIGGMKMLLPVETCLVEVTVRGINFRHWASHGVCIEVEPLHGAGAMAVDAAKLIDDTEDARRIYFAKSDAARFVRNNQPRSQSSDKQWRSCLLSLRNVLTPEQTERFDQKSNKILQGKTIAKSNVWELEKLLPILASVKFDLDLADVDVPDDD